MARPGSNPAIELKDLPNCSIPCLLIRHVQISHNTPFLPPQILHNLCFLFLLGVTAVPREIENNAYAKFWGANRVHFGRYASGE